MPSAVRAWRGSALRARSSVPPAHRIPGVLPGPHRILLHATSDGPLAGCASRGASSDSVVRHPHRGLRRLGRCNREVGREADSAQAIDERAVSQRSRMREAGSWEHNEGDPALAQLRAHANQKVKADARIRHTVEDHGADESVIGP
eukprot:scaffold7341_cov129-Isochrysis_galbana.AAC.3